MNIIVHDLLTLLSFLQCVGTAQYEKDGVTCKGQVLCEGCEYSPRQ